MYLCTVDEIHEVLHWVSDREGVEVEDGAVMVEHDAVQAVVTSLPERGSLNEKRKIKGHL